jgi:predicted RNase H-like nuclease (RuvC/YqgF family)
MTAVIGIDPGVNMGIAVYYKGRLLELETWTVLHTIQFINDELDDKKLIVIEDSRLQSYMFTGAKDNRLSALKQARNLGSVDGICTIIEAICATKNIDLICISPKQKGKKLTAKEFEQKTGWTKSSNQHERDAACVAWRYRNGVKL